MSTRAYVGILKSNKSIDVIFTHWDGYPQHHGPILFQHYGNSTAVRLLLASGSHEGLEPDPRDGKPRGDKPEHFESFEGLFQHLKTAFWISYIYLWDVKHSRWIFTSAYPTPIKFKSLTMKDCKYETRNTSLTR
jgi:hypothetical protein